MSGWWIASLWTGGGTLLVLALCKAAARGDRPDREE